MQDFDQRESESKNVWHSSQPCPSCASHSLCIFTYAHLPSRILTFLYKTLKKKKNTTQSRYYFLHICLYYTRVCIASVSCHRHRDTFASEIPACYSFSFLHCSTRRWCCFPCKWAAKSITMRDWALYICLTFKLPLKYIVCFFNGFLGKGIYIHTQRTLSRYVLSLFVRWIRCSLGSGIGTRCVCVSVFFFSLVHTRPSQNGILTWLTEHHISIRVPLRKRFRDWIAAWPLLPPPAHFLFIYTITHARIYSSLLLAQKPIDCI